MTICTVFFLTAFGQDSNSIEQKLLMKFQRITYWQITRVEMITLTNTTP